MLDLCNVMSHLHCHVITCNIYNDYIYGVHKCPQIPMSAFFGTVLATLWSFWQLDISKPYLETFYPLTWWLTYPITNSQFHPIIALRPSYHKSVKRLPVITSPNLWNPPSPISVNKPTLSEAAQSKGKGSLDSFSPLGK